MLSNATLGNVFTSAADTPGIPPGVCFRDEPEYMGYASLEPYILAGGFACLGIWMISLATTVMCSMVHRSCSRQVVVVDARYHELEDTTVIIDTTATDSDGDVYLNLDNLSQQHRNERQRRGQDYDLFGGWKYVPRISVLKTPKCITCMSRCVRWLCALLVSLTFMVAFILILVAPKVPEFSVCESATEWGSTIERTVESIVMHAKVEIDEYMVVSVYNPNHVDLRLRNLDGHFKYSGDDVGSFGYQSATADSTVMFPKGSITDLYLNVKLNPSIKHAAGMGYAYERGTLVMSVVASLSVDVFRSGYKVYSTDYDVPEYSFTMDTLQVEWCKKCEKKHWFELGNEVGELEEE